MDGAAGYERLDKPAEVEILSKKAIKSKGKSRGSRESLLRRKINPTDWPGFLYFVTESQSAAGICRNGMEETNRQAGTPVVQWSIGTAEAGEVGKCRGCTDFDELKLQERGLRK